MSFNQQGPPGTAGKDGATKVFGTFKNFLGDVPDDTQDYNGFDLGRDPVVTLALPAGLFHIEAKLVAEMHGAIRKGFERVGCALVSGQQFDGAVTTLKEEGDTQTLSLELLAGVDAGGGMAELRCTDYGTGASLRFIKVHGTQVQDISNPPAA
jgi:hypothetical protein